MTSDSEKTPLTVPPRKSRTHFSSTWTTVFACVGLAVGTGNLWRFPRIVAETAGENGALVFILVWFVFLFLWSIPMLFIEYGLGRYTQRGVMQSFHYTIGIKYMWAALFLASISFLIGCYYTVIMGWSLYYMFIIMIHPLPATYEASSRVFYDYTDVGWPVLTQFISLLLTALATIRGVRTIERVNTVITPTFLLIIIALWIWSLTKAHAWRGLCFLFSPDWGTLKNPMLWVEALSQNAFDTGAGSGMFITYSSYIAREESIGKYAVGIPIGNNIISLICGMTSFSTVFSSMITEHPNITNAEILDILQTSGPGGSGISFIWYPVLLASAGMGGRVIGVIFYGGLFFAGLSSNIPNIENATRNLTDVGAKRAIVLPVLTILIFLGGLGSSLNLNILVNQDFTWGFALLLTGFLLQMLVIKYGSKTFREVLLNSQSPNDWKVPVIWEWIVKYVAPVEAMFVICWWIVNNIMKGDGHGNPWYELHPETLMTVFMQWIILVFILLIFNLIVYRHQPNPIVEHLDDGKFDTLHEGDCSSAMDGQEMKDAASRRMKEAEGGPVETPTSDTPAVKEGEEEEEKTS